MVNSLYGNNRLLDRWRWPRLPHEYHGSGCTLASAIAALLAQSRAPDAGQPLDESIPAVLYRAQHFTWHALQAAYPVGSGQWIPNRLFWSKPL